MKKPIKQEPPAVPDIIDLPEVDEAFAEELLTADLRAAFERMAGVEPKPAEAEEPPVPRKKSA